VWALTLLLMMFEGNHRARSTRATLAADIIIIVLEQSVSRLLGPDEAREFRRGSFARS
jgi:hypothetical protein